MRLPLLIIPLIIFLDQVTKAEFATSCNSGVAFSLFSNVGILTVFVPIFIVGSCLIFLLRSKSKLVFWALSIIVGGGLSNIVDRLTVGCVRDFIDLKFWPSFNLADSAVVFGVSMLIYSVLTKVEVKNSNDSNH